MNLPEVWTQLEEDPRLSGNAGRAQRRIVPASRWDFFLGLKMPSRRRMLIMRVSSDAVDASPEVPDSRGLAVRMLTRDPGACETEIEIVLLDNSHRDIFDSLIEDLVQASEGATNERTGVSQFLSRLSNWQELLRRLAPGGLSRVGQQGLWGELCVLREVIAPVTGVTGAVGGWRGPLGGDQDFQIGNVAVEVKTSVQNSFDNLSIASERQLEVPEDVELVLIALSLDGRSGHGETLPDMVGDVRTVASESGCLHVLNDRLETLGYYDDDAHLYTELGYTVREESFLRVSKGFPRITSGDLPTGVSGLTYSVSMASCGPYRTSRQNLREMLKC